MERLSLRQKQKVTIRATIKATYVVSKLWHIYYKINVKDLNGNGIWSKIFWNDLHILLEKDWHEFVNIFVDFSRSYIAKKQTNKQTNNKHDENCIAITKCKMLAHACNPNGLCVCNMLQTDTSVFALFGLEWTILKRAWWLSQKSRLHNTQAISKSIFYEKKAKWRLQCLKFQTVSLWYESYQQSKSTSILVT